MSTTNYTKSFYKAVAQWLTATTDYPVKEVHDMVWRGDSLVISYTSAEGKSVTLHTRKPKIELLNSLIGDFEF